MLNKLGGNHMALTIEELYDSSKSKYRLKYVAGNNGFKNFVSWVQFTEDIKTVGFLKGGELIITTGLNRSEKQWIYEFISELIRQNSAGLIINIGNYIKIEDISLDVIELCNREKFPLFLMPWEIRLSDIMQDYCNRVLLHSKEQDDRTRMIQCILHEPKRILEEMSELDKVGFSKYGGYQVLLIQISEGGYDNLRKYKLRIDRICSQVYEKYHIYEEKDKLVVLVFPEDLFIVKKMVKAIETSEKKLMIFCGDLMKEIGQAYLSYEQAEIASMYGIYEKKRVVFFEEIGIYKILSMIKETYLLETIVEETLGKLLEYDRHKSGALIETLEIYMKYDGSVRLVAEHLFTHRNTINYRVKKIREILQQDIDKMEMKFKIQLAFYVIKYLKISGY